LKTRQIGLLGCGTIGEELARAVDNDSVANATLHALYDISKEKAITLSSKLRTRPPVCEDINDFFSRKFDLLIEAASQEAAKSVALRALTDGRDVMIMSAGAMIDQAYFEEIFAASEKFDTRLYIPTGAIAGIDAIRSVRNLIDSITLTTTKNPKALIGAPFFQSTSTTPGSIVNRTLLFEGTAADAVKLFPANVNVAAAISLAGIGATRTRVKVIADPNSKTNLHQISVNGSFGEIRIEVDNTPSPKNPKTSYLAVLSALECLRSICESRIKIGT
jgi:aspartate dehydrogenase